MVGETVFLRVVNLWMWGVTGVRVKRCKGYITDVNLPENKTTLWLDKLKDFDFMHVWQVRLVDAQGKSYFFLTFFQTLKASNTFAYHVETKTVWAKMLLNSIYFFNFGFASIIIYHIYPFLLCGALPEIVSMLNGWLINYSHILINEKQTEISWGLGARRKQTIMGSVGIQQTRFSGSEKKKAANKKPQKTESWWISENPRAKKTRTHTRRQEKCVKPVLKFWFGSVSDDDAKKGRLVVVDQHKCECKRVVAR